jgi:uncharacterized membrane protein
MKDWNVDFFDVVALFLTASVFVAFAVAAIAFAFILLVAVGALILPST